MDERIADEKEAHGGTGKSLVGVALSQMVATHRIDGKLFNPSKNFAYQGVNHGTRLLIFDDVKPKFPFEALFSQITDGLTIEMKFKDEYTIPFEMSPKQLISTNYVIVGQGNSFERRKLEIEFGGYFRDTKSPEEEFDHRLFDDWSMREWELFDRYMIHCLQLFLQNGLVDYTKINALERRLIAQTKSEAVEYLDDRILVPDRAALKSKMNRIEKASFYQEFIQRYPDFQNHLKQRTFNSWVKIWAESRGITFTESKSNGRNYFNLSK